MSARMESDSMENGPPMAKRFWSFMESILLAACVAGFLATILFGAIGGVAMGIAPKTAFGWTAPLLCPPGSFLEYRSVVRSYHRPGESEPHLDCYWRGDRREDVLLKGIALVLGGSWLLVFGASFPVLAVIFLKTAMGIGKFIGKKNSPLPGPPFSILL
jgi:hypothetical protein